MRGGFIEAPRSAATYITVVSLPILTALFLLSITRPRFQRA